ncbi:MAG: GTP-binding protein, partial [Casimicrobiaceae bacterium]
MAGIELPLVAAGSPGEIELLRFIACGSVDDGKSTLLGRLINESRSIGDDQLAALKADSRKFGTRGGEIDYALLLDGLAAEREQGTTIDVAYRYFSTARRRYIAADTPGHEHYTRNMVTGASTADLAIVLVDARKGLTEQTRRHSYIVALLGVRLVVLAINKMDLVDYSQAVHDDIKNAYREFAHKLGVDDVTCIPVSAVHGDNIVAPMGNTGWYRGPMLMEHLETVGIGNALDRGAFRMPVQWVSRPNPDFRGFAGTIVSGVVRPGDAIDVQPSGLRTRVARIVTADGDLPLAVANQSITLTLADEIDVGRGDVIGALSEPCASADQFEASLIWMDSAPMLRGRNYLMKIGTRTVNATIAPLKYKVNMHALEHVAADKLELNDIGICDLECDRAIAFEPYAVN